MAISLLFSHGRTPNRTSPPAGPLAGQSAASTLRWTAASGWTWTRSSCTQRRWCCSTRTAATRGFLTSSQGGEPAGPWLLDPYPLRGGSSPAELERNKVQIQLCGNVLSQPPSKALKKKADFRSFLEASFGAFSERVSAQLC